MRIPLYALGALLFLAGLALAFFDVADEVVSVAEEGPFGAPEIDLDWSEGDLEPSPEREAEIRARERDAARMSTRLRLPHGTLTVRARVAKGSLPVGVEVGYRRLGGEPRWLNVREGGARTIVDAPLGEVTAVARGPGLPLREQKVRVEAGVPAEAVITLKPTEDTDSVRTSGG